jgi:hypothetical protein
MMMTSFPVRSAILEEPPSGRLALNLDKETEAEEQPRIKLEALRRETQAKLGASC